MNLREHRINMRIAEGKRLTKMFITVAVVVAIVIISAISALFIINRKLKQPKN